MYTSLLSSPTLAPTDQRDETFVKFLLPSYVPGMIIGSAGATVAELMESTNTIVKFSPGRELYPGTSERVCVIIGSIPDICIALKRIFAKMSDPTHAKSEEIQEYLQVFKMLISNISAGMAIGKSGQTIKAIQQECSVKIQISNKENSDLPERSLSIIGDSTDIIIAAVRLVLEHTKDDPDASKWKKLLTYSGYSGKPQGDSHHGHGHGHGHGHHGSHISRLGGGASAGSHGTAASYSGLADQPSLGASSFLSMFQQSPSYGSAFQSAATAQAGGGASLNQAMISYAYAQSLMTNSSYYGQFSPVMVDGVNLMIPGATLATFDIAVPEVMVSSVVGPGAKLLTDLMHSTGTRIQLSAKGEYIPGTFNRKLTIAGPILSVQAAHMVVTQKILKEQETYRKQGLI